VVILLVIFKERDTMSIQTSLAVQIQQPGGPEMMALVTVEVADPGPGQVRVAHHAIGLNFIDVYQRTGLYPLPLPLTLGMEGAGVVEAVGDGVTHLSVGDRVAYAANPPGSYSQRRVMPAMNVCRDDAQRLDGAIPAQTLSSGGGSGVR
jgi:NADPH2:quinone reductase